MARGASFGFRVTGSTSHCCCPKKKERRTPFSALPHPYQVVHIMEIQSPNLRHTSGQQVEPRFSRENPFVQFNRKRKAGSKYCVMTLSLAATADSVPADQIEKHREFVEEIWKESAWHMTLPLGYSKIKPGRNFGMLPAPVSTTAVVNQPRTTVNNPPPSPAINHAAPLAKVEGQPKSTPQALTRPDRVSPATATPASSASAVCFGRDAALWVKIVIIIVSHRAAHPDVGCTGENPGPE